jgi:phosphopantetheine adenylyltransferase
LVKQSAIWFIRCRTVYKLGATSRFAEKIAITKETTNITQEVNMYRATKGVPQIRVS